MNIKRIFQFMFLITVSTNLTAENTERNLHCECIADGGNGLCNFEFFDQAAGETRHDWYRTIYVNEEQEPDDEMLAKACWRKRDVDEQGAGLCCSLNNDESDAMRFFKGALRD